MISVTIPSPDLLTILLPMKPANRPSTIQAKMIFEHLVLAASFVSGEAEVAVRTVPSCYVAQVGFKDEVLHTDGAPQPYGEIFVMHYDGTQVEQLTDNQWEDGGPTWQIHRADSAQVTPPAK
jgi:hypothetical protein